MILPPERAPELLNYSLSSNPTPTLSTMAESQPPQPNPAEVDFSEFLWMENEEEFDTEVLRELEEEDMINYYYELYEESLNSGESNGSSSRSGGSGQGASGGSGPGPSGGSGTGPSGSSSSTQPNHHASNSNPRTDPVDDLSRDVSRLTFSTLNPNAAEFVPRGFGGSSSSNVANNVGNISGPSSSSNNSNTSTSSQQGSGDLASNSSH